MPGIRPKEFDIDLAIGRAVEAFWKHGYEKTTLNDLLEHTGIARQSLYNTFGDKKGLFLRALKRYTEDRLEDQRCLLSNAPTPFEGLKRMAEHWSRFADPTGCSGCFLVNTATEFGSEDIEVAEQVTQSLAAFRDVLVDQVKQAKSGGELPGSLDAECYAQNLLTTFFGIASLGRVPGAAQFVSDTVLCIHERLDSLNSMAK